MPADLDALYREPELVSPDYPASGRILRLIVRNSVIFGMLYLPQGPGPHPVALMLHGLPGSVRNEDVAQALRWSGVAALIFSYRGSWGSGGTWSYNHCLEDALTICGQLQDPAFAAANRLDPDRIIVIGHSFGGLMAMLTACEKNVREVVLISPADAARQWREASATPEGRARRMRRLEQICEPLGGTCAEQMWQETADHLARFDLRAAIPRLTDQRFLLIGAQYDTLLPLDRYFTPLRDALEQQVPGRVSSLLLPTGHNYNSHRMELCRAILQWLQ